MATKKGASKPRTQPSESKATTMRNRTKRIDSLYLLQAMRPPEIVDALFAEGMFVGVNRASALRMVQDRVATVRGEANPAINLSLQRPAERQRYVARLEQLLREEWAVINSEEIVTKQRTTATGDVFTVEEPKYNAKAKQEARKHARELTVAIGLVTGVDTKGEGIGAEDESAKKSNEPRVPFVIETTGSAFDALVQANIGGGKVN